MRVLIASGGSGGHIFPAVCVQEEIKKRVPGARLLLMGAGNGGVEGVLGGEDDSTVRLPAVGMPRKMSVDLASFALRLAVSFDRSVRRIASFRPHVAIGFGNFASFAPLIAAKSWGVPIAIHEANAVPGKANLVLSRFADRVLLNFGSAGRYFVNRNVKVVGMPVRSEFVEPRDRLGALARLKLSGTKFTLLVIGGSQGARALNKEVCSILGKVGGKVQFIHLTGKSDYGWVRRCYERSLVGAYVAAFEGRMKLLYDAADLVLARAGASSIGEIVQTGKPAVLVPFPYATDGHQEANARLLGEKGGAIVLREERSPSGETRIPGVGEWLLRLAGERERLREMGDRNRMLAKGCAAEKIVDELLGMVRPESVVVGSVERRVAVPA